jgi:signal transduction histidine kinase
MVTAWAFELRGAVAATLVAPLLTLATAALGAGKPAAVTLVDLSFWLGHGAIGLVGASTAYLVSLRRRLEEAMAARAVIEEARRKEHAARIAAEVEARLERSERMATLGVLTAGFAHELGNPLTFLMAVLPDVRRGVEASAAALLAHPAPSGGVAKDLEALGPRLGDAVKATEQIRAVLGQVRGLARERPAAMLPVDLRAVAELAVRLVRPQQRGRARVALTAPDSVLVRADETRILQVLINLLTNAVQAFPSERDLGSVRLTVRAEGARAVIEVADDGVGMDAETVTHVFEPFFTRRPPGEGTGLGLSIADSIVRQLGGSIEVKSAPGEGTTMCVSMPLLDGQAQQAG